MIPFKPDGPYDIHRDGVPDRPMTQTPAYQAAIGPWLIELAAQREGLVVYLGNKARSGDWHAVQDAASDLREVEAQIAVLKELQG